MPFLNICMLFLKCFYFVSDVFLYTVLKCCILKSSFYVVVLRRSWKLRAGFFH